MSNYISFKYENLATILRGRAFELVEFRLILCTLSDINFFPDINFVTTVSLSACNLLYLHSVCHGKEIILWDSVLRTNGQNKTIFSVYTVLIINWYKTTTNKCLSYETLFRFDFFLPVKITKINKNFNKASKSSWVKVPLLSFNMTTYLTWIYKIYTTSVSCAQLYERISIFFLEIFISFICYLFKLITISINKRHRQVKKENRD